MKIILTVHQFFPEYFSGTETLVYETAKELVRQGHVVSVVTAFPSTANLQDSERFDRYVYDDIPVERFHHDYVPMGTQSNILELEYYNKLFGSFFENYLSRERPDIVHFFHLSRLSSSAVDVCSRLKIKMVFTPTDFWFICPTIQLRLPGNQPCPGPNKNSVNCLRHVVYLTQPKKITFLMQLIPDWLVRVLIYFSKNLSSVSNYAVLINTLIGRKDFLLERLNGIDRIIVPTQIMKFLLAKNGLNVDKTTFVPFGLNLSYVEGSSRPDPLSNVLRLGYIGTLSEPKGVHILLEAIEKLPGIPLELKIYGQVEDFPDYVTKLKKIIKDDPRIKFLGTFPNREIGSIFMGLDALVVPSLWYENSPLVVYSAQAAGCPVIASDTKGISEVIEHQKNGLLFEAGNVSALMAMIELLVDDRNLLQDLSNNAKQPLSMQEYGKRLSEVYNELLLGIKSK